jgi:ATP-dependent Clp endopeptidase proteolytic subunit ClpP
MPKKKETKVIVLSGQIGWDVTASDVRKELNAVKNQPVRIDLNSPGGFVFEGIEIFNLIKDHKGETEVRLMALAASMGSYIALAGDRVSAFDNATFMIHNALTIAIGNHNELRTVANRLEGISGLLAKAYIAKTGKSSKEIKQMMDDETFLFGDEMLDAGFVDEIIKADPESKDKLDKDSAIVEAKLRVESCFDKMRKSEEAKVDFQKAAAYLGEIPVIDINENKQEVQTKKGGNKMPTLKELLAENPGANIEFSQAMTDAEAKGAESKRVEIQSNLDKLAPIVASVSYPGTIRSLISEVLQGKEDYAALKGAVTMHDAQVEKEKEMLALKEKEKETPPEQKPVVSEDGTINNEADYQAEKERMKEVT